MITVIISIRDELQRSNRYFHLKYILISSETEGSLCSLLQVLKVNLKKKNPSYLTHTRAITLDCTEEEVGVSFASYVNSHTQRKVCGKRFANQQSRYFANMHASSFLSRISFCRFHTPPFAYSPISMNSSASYVSFQITTLPDNVAVQDVEERQTSRRN